MPGITYAKLVQTYAFHVVFTLSLQWLGPELTLTRSTHLACLLAAGFDGAAVPETDVFGKTPGDRRTPARRRAAGRRRFPRRILKYTQVCGHRALVRLHVV